MSLYFCYRKLSLAKYAIQLKHERLILWQEQIIPSLSISLPF